MKTLGARIREARKNKGWSIDDLANELAVSKQAVSHWELDRHEPKRDTLIELAKILEVSYSWLVAGDDDFDASALAYKSTRMVPVVEWGWLKNMKKMKAFLSSESPVTRVPVPVNGSKYMFAVPVKTTELKEGLPRGYTIIVDPELVPKNKSYVIVRLDKDGIPTLRMFTTESGKPYLKTDDPRIPYDIVSKTTQIIGTVCYSFRTMD